MHARLSRKPRHRFNGSRTRLVAAIAAAVWSGQQISSAAADTWTWNGAAADFDWSNGGDWTHTSGSINSATPVSSNNTVVDFAGSTTLFAIQNIANPFVLNSLGFNAGAAEFQISGNTLAFQTNSGGTAPTIVQNSSSFQQFVQTLSLVNTTTFTGSGTGIVAFNDPITGAGALIDNSTTSAIELAATNTYAGGTTVSGSQIFFTNNKAFGSGTITFANGGTVTGANDVLLQNPFAVSSGAATFEAADGTTLTENATGASFGSLNFGSAVESGTVNFEPGVFTFFGGTIDVNGGTVLDGADALSQILGSYNVAIVAGATLNVNGFNTTIKNLTGAGTLATGSNSNETFTLAAANFSGGITGSGRLAVSSGTVVLSGSNSYSGGSALSGGVVGAGNSSALSNGVVSVIDNSQLFAAGANESLSNAISLTTGKTLTVVSNPTTAHSLTLSGAISGNGGLVMSGSGKLILSGSNTYTGGTTLNSGEIDINSASSLGSTLAIVNLNGGAITSLSTLSSNYAFENSTTTNAITFQAANGTALTLDGSFNLGSGDLDFGSAADAGTVLFNPDFGGDFQTINANGGSLVDVEGSLGSIITGDTLNIASSATVNLNGNSASPASLTGAGKLMLGSSSGATLTLTSANYSGVISGSGVVAVTGGTVALSGSNTYSSGSILSGGGLLSAGNNGALGSGSVAVTGSLNISAAATGGVTLANPISINSGQTLTVVSDPSGNRRLLLNGNISGSGGLAMSGVGILMLDSSNSFSGGTTLNSGQIITTNAAALGSGPLTANGGTFTSNVTASINGLNDAGTNPVSIQAAPGTSLTLQGAGNLNLGNVLNFGSTAETGQIIYSFGSISGSSGFRGQYNINGGVLMDGSGLLSQYINLDEPVISVAANATLDLDNNSASIFDLLGAGNVSTGLVSGISTLTLNGANFSGTILGGDNLIISGGTVILSGTNTYVGGTAIGSGTVGVGSALALGDNSGFQNGLGLVSVFSSSLFAAGADQTLANPFTLNSGNTLTIVDDPNGAHNLTLNGNIGGGGALAMNSAGTLILSGTNTYSGGTTVSGGAVGAGNNSAFGSGPVNFTASSNLFAAGGSQVLANPISIASGANLNVVNDPAGPHILDLGGNITGSGSLTMSGAGALVLGVSNSYSGGTTINSGEVDITGPNSFGSTLGSITQNGGSIVAFNNITLPNSYDDTTASGTVSIQAVPGATLALAGSANIGSQALNFGSPQRTGTVNFEPSGASLGFPNINVLGGTLAGNVDLAIVISGDPLFIASSATVNLNGFSANPSNLTGGGNLMLGSNPTEDLSLNTADFTGVISGSGNVFISNGNVTLAPVTANTYTGLTTITNNASAVLGAGGLPMFGNVLNNSTLTIQGSNTAGRITGNGVLLLNNGAVFKLAAEPAPDTVGVVGVAADSTLDITNNQLFVNYGQVNMGWDPIVAIQADLASGYAGGAWVGLGIDSSAAAVRPQYSVGYADGAADVGTPAGSNQILIAFTIAGDADLDGSVGFSDLIAVAQNFGKTGQDWVHGNFVYDPTGSVGFSDLILVAQHFGLVRQRATSSGEPSGLSPLWLSGGGSIESISAVPEPAGLALIAAGGLALRRRRGKRRR